METPANRWCDISERREFVPSGVVGHALRLTIVGYWPGTPL